ncbi:MAG: hypothetical protein OXE46_01410 [Chloroflexi bacterium]|nr:hypothetical protein [Chloroflexota bacterium]
MQITIYTDGACDIHAPNRPGGWASILRASDDSGALLKETVISGGQENTTNNQMELRAVIEGIKALNNPAKVTVVSDSRYVIDIARGAKKPKANKTLWQEFRELTAGQYIHWRYVEGHSGDPLNERCDKLAVAERSKRALQKPQAQPAPLPETPYAVYLSTRYHRGSRSTGWGAIIVAEGETHQKCGCLPGISELEGTLIGAIAALQSLPADADATMLTAQEYLAKGMNLWLAGWQARGWRTRDGKPVKHQRHWRMLRELQAGRRLYFRFVKARDGMPQFEQGKALAAEALQDATASGSG